MIGNSGKPGDGPKTGAGWIPGGKPTPAPKAPGAAKMEQVAPAEEPSAWGGPAEADGCGSAGAAENPPRIAATLKETPLDQRLAEKGAQIGTSPAPKAGPNREANRKIARETAIGLAAAAALGLCIYAGVAATSGSGAPPDASPSAPAAAEAEPREAAPEGDAAQGAQRPAASPSTITFDMTMDKWKKGSSTPLLAHIYGTDEMGEPVDLHAVVTNKEVSVDVPCGGYTVSYASPINSDGSIYEMPDPSSIRVGEHGAVVVSEMRHIAASKVGADEVDAACGKIARFISETTSPVLKDQGAEILEKAYEYAAANPAKKKAAAGNRKDGDSGASASAQESPANTPPPTGGTARTSTEPRSTSQAASASAQKGTSAQPSQAAAGKEAEGSTGASRDKEDAYSKPVEKQQEEKAEGTSASKSWVGEEGHFELDAQGRSTWVVDVAGHWE